jgi:hypothetical protein
MKGLPLVASRNKMVKERIEIIRPEQQNGKLN